MLLKVNDPLTQEAVKESALPQRAQRRRGRQNLKKLEQESNASVVSVVGFGSYFTVSAAMRNGRLGGGGSTARHVSETNPTNLTYAVARRYKDSGEDKPKPAILLVI